jgi:hypothetical protein
MQSAQLKYCPFEDNFSATFGIALGIKNTSNGERKGGLFRRFLHGKLELWVKELKWAFNVKHALSVNHQCRGENAF